MVVNSGGKTAVVPRDVSTVCSMDYICYYSIYVFVPNDSIWFPTVVILPSNATRPASTDLLFSVFEVPAFLCDGAFM